MSEIIISTERLHLRMWQPSDSELFCQMNSDAEVMRYFPQTLSAQETVAMTGRIKKHFTENGFGLYAVEVRCTGAFIGFTGFVRPTFESFFTPCIEIGWRLKKEAWGQGFATEAARACLQYGFEVLGFEKVVSFTSTGNKNSEKVMQKIGMKRSGLFDHPLIENDHPLCRHVLYEVEKDDFKKG